MKLLQRITLVIITLCAVITIKAQGQNPVTITQRNGVAYYEYPVESSEGGYAVARKFGVTLLTLVKANPEADLSALKPGQILLVPVKESTGYPTVQQATPIGTSLPQQQTDPSATYEPAQVVTDLAATHTFNRIEGPRPSMHIIAPQETLYGVSRMYGITVNELIEANPTLSTDHFPIGASIKIPNEGITFTPPQKFVSTPTYSVAPNSSISDLTIALVLPMGTPGKVNARFLEFYKGFLLAADTMRIGANKQAKIELFNCNDQHQDLDYILYHDQMSDADIIIGGTNAAEIGLLSEYANARGIWYISPFSSKEQDVVGRPQTLQVNPSPSYSQSTAGKIYAKELRGKHAIFISTPADTANKSKIKFINRLMLDLQDNGTSFTQMQYDVETFHDDIKLKLATDSTIENIIIPVSPQLKVLGMIVPTLRQNINKENPPKISIWGYPEWQVGASRNINDFSRLQAQLFATFFANNNSPEYLHFAKKYGKYYNQALKNTYPQYGIMGYDIGLWSIIMLTRYGKAFDPGRPHTLPSEMLIQSDFDFKQEGAGNGYINNNLFIVRFNPDFNTVKEIIQ